MKNPFKPLIDELKIRKQENEELHISVLQEIERLKTERENKPKSKFRKIGFVDNIANKISNSNDEKALKIFQEQKQKELAILREQRKNDYLISIFALLGLFIIIIALIITIGVFCEKSNSNKVNNETSIEQEANTEYFSDYDVVVSEQETADNNSLVDNSETIEIENDTYENTEAENQSENEFSEQNIVVPESTNSSNTTNTTNNVSTTYSNERMVWIPTNGGNKYHSKPSCSKMKNPKEISLEQATKSGYTACQKCN